MHVEDHYVLEAFPGFHEISEDDLPKAAVLCGGRPCDFSKYFPEED